MRRTFFEMILEDLVEADPFFQQRKDALGPVAFSSHQKLTSLAYRTSAG